MKLTALGLIYYDHICLKDEQLRLGSLFTWGEEIPNFYAEIDANGEPVQITSQNNAFEDGKERVEKIREALDRMKDWQRYVAYSSFGLNALFLLWGLLYFVLKCCCCCRCEGATGRRIKELEKLLALQVDYREESSRIESSRLELM